MDRCKGIRKQNRRNRNENARTAERKSSDPLRFLFGSSVCYPPFAKTRRFTAQTIARWRKRTQTSRRKPRMVSAIFFWSFWLFFFLHNIFCFYKNSLCTVQNRLARQRSLKRIGISSQSTKRTRTFLLSWCGKHCFLGFPAYIGGAEGCFLAACKNVMRNVLKNSGRRKRLAMCKMNNSRRRYSNMAGT